MESIEAEVCVESGKSDRQGRRKNGGALVVSEQLKPKFRELSLSASPEGMALNLEVSLPDGTLLRGAQASELAKLVQLLRS